MEICDDDDEEDDHMQDVQHITPAHSVVALLRADARAPMCLEPILVSLVPITYGPVADLMGTGLSQTVNVRPQATSPQIVIDNTPPF